MTENENNIYSEMCKSEIPFSAISNQIHIEIFSNRKLLAEGYFNVLEYSDTLISLKLKKGLLSILGAELSISSVGDGRMTVVGKIINVSFDG